MQLKAITVGIDAAGKSKIISGPDVPERDQTEAFRAYKVGVLPKGVQRIELYYIEKQTVGVSAEARATREADEKAARDAQAEAAEKEKWKPRGEPPAKESAKE